MRKKDESKVVGIIYFCDNLKKEFRLNDVEYNLTANSSDCETCGSHGEIKLYTTDCECGKLHDIEIRGW